jgi:eukaryotic-like serine/threonine-protein kinase
MESLRLLPPTVRRTAAVDQPAEDVRSASPAPELGPDPLGSDAEVVDLWASECPGEYPSSSESFSEAPGASPRVVRLPAEAVATLPQVGSTFLGFRLDEQLGRGAFARVFLARQVELADRPVALKISAERHDEAQALAGLRHPNIVPVYSVHRAGRLQALCMPYLGSLTLADVYRDLEGMPSLPQSGKGLVTTLMARQGTTCTSRVTPSDRPGSAPDLAPERSGPVVPPGESARPGPADTLRMLEGMGYVEAVLWLAARLADGLAHAHGRGIVHRDLKPANILLADDGQPMLLDFNLSEDARPRDGATSPGVGGTVPYMSPEQLQAYSGADRRVDQRSDVYALGVILFELLTRRHPFPTPAKLGSEGLACTLQARLQPPPRLRPRNPAVSPAVESIVRRCLEPDPERRYQSAADLKEDLQRHLADLPLLHAADRSPGERLRKWRRRHRLLAATAGLLTAAVVVVAILAPGFVERGRRLARLEAAESLRRTAEDVRAARALLLDREAGREQQEEGVRLCRSGLERFGALAPRPWQEHAAVQALDAGEREQLGEHVGNLLFLLAEALRQRAPWSADANPEGQLRQALELNTRALACYQGRETPPALWRQRADLAGILGEKDEERRSFEQLRIGQVLPDNDPTPARRSPDSRTPIGVAPAVSTRGL